LKRVTASLVNVPRSEFCACGRVSVRFLLLEGVTGADSEAETDD
jgi:hypothetical protein